MKKKYIFCCICIFAFFSCVSNGGGRLLNESELLQEYKLLYVDLSNVRTWGYKSYFNNEINKADENINISQGTLVSTRLPTDFAILREGFFKIRLENDLPGYTRSGNFIINADGNISTLDGYLLYDNISFEDLFLPDTIRVTREHDVYVTIPERNGKLTEIKVGQLLTYKVPGEALVLYKDSVYIIKDGAEFTEEITFDNSIIQGVLEYSNVFTLPVALRMYYILSVINKNLVPNIEFKKELLRTQIEKMTNDDFLLYEAMITTNRRLMNIIEKNLSDAQTTIYPDYEQNVFDRYLNARLYYLGSILPYIKYDY